MSARKFVNSITYSHGLVTAAGNDFILASDVPDLSATYQPLDPLLTSLSALADPNADRILFWDDSAGDLKWLSLGSGLSITGTTLDATGLTADSITAGYLHASAASVLFGRGSAGGAGAGQEITTGDSVTFVGTALKLDGDDPAPGNSMYYGTDSGGTKGWYALPGAAPDATTVTYTPGNAMNWAGSPPTTVQEALDRIAQALAGGLAIFP